MSRVGLVVVSHSARLAEGVVEVAAQMAPDVVVVAAGGSADGGIGTDFDAVAGALGRAGTGAGVVVLYDLGSARMVAEMAVESIEDPESAVVVDAPLVEAAVAAAVAAQGGADLAAVAGTAREAAAFGAAAEAERAGVPAAEAERAGVPAAEAERAGVPAADAERAGVPAADAERAGVPAAGAESAGVPAAEADLAGSAESAETAGVPAGEAEPVVSQILLTNEVGLHARPAALLARTLSEVDASVTVRFGERSADGTSVLALMSLGARGGDEVGISATGPQADEAMRRVRDLAARGFDE